MAALINRTPTGRLISLHAELKYLDKRFGSEEFELKGLKYDADSSVNPLMFFPLTKTYKGIGLYDPYLDNPLSPAKFHLTQSIQYDSQKSKSASECLNALEALGWVERKGSLSMLTGVGKNLATINYESPEFVKISRNSVLGYGPFVGFLYKCRAQMNKENIVNKSDIEIGYKDTHEEIEQNGERIPLSTGSQKDTIVRTRATLFAWAVTTGFSLPVGLSEPEDISVWHLRTLEEIAKKHWGWGKMKMFIPDDLFDGSHVVDRPLEYRWMTKSTKALRERGQQSIRTQSMAYETKVKNRRFAIVYALAKASEESKSLDLIKLIDSMLIFEELFVVNRGDFKRVMDIEKDIAFVAGIPFEIDGNLLKPKTKINIQSLTKGAPVEVVKAIDIAMEKN